MFVYKAMIEGLEGGQGEGYSKKESQQAASKAALQSLRRKPQFIDAVFAAKTERTKMEEEPVQTVPDIEPKDDFIITSQQKEKPLPSAEAAPAADEGRTDWSGNAVNAAEVDEFDLSDIKTIGGNMSKEDIIAAAEAAAFSEK